MIKRSTTTMALVLALLATSSQADPIQDWISRLESEGFEIVKTRRTWLGRFQVIAISDGVQREVVISLGSGEILRDLSTPVQSDNSAPMESASKQTQAKSSKSPEEKIEDSKDHVEDERGSPPEKREKPERPERPERRATE